MYWTDYVSVAVSVLALGLSGYIFFNFERKHQKIDTGIHVDDNQINYYSFIVELIKAMKDIDPAARELLIRRLEDAGFFNNETDLLKNLRKFA
jgi:hypothetical protein